MTSPPPIPLLQREPYRLLMPLGVALAWAGTGHWLLYALGLLERYAPVFHALTQVQGFLLCFALGFLFTMIPRRTQSFPPSRLELALAVVGPVGTTAAAAFERWALSQAFFLVTSGTAIVFLVRRMRGARARRRPPASFVWLPVAFAMGIGGALAAAVGAAGAPERWWLHQLGQRLVLQGMFLGLILGVGGLVIPLMTRGEAPPDAGKDARSRALRAAHGLAAVALLLSFWIEQQGAFREGLVLRAGVVGVTLLAGAALWRPPSRPGWNRWLIWTAAWMVPLGYAVAALAPGHWKAGLHVTFIAGFAMLALSVGTQVILGHTGNERLRDGRPPAVPCIGGLLLAATVFRVLVDFDPGHLTLWLGLASGLFLLATAVWGVFLVPLLWRAGTHATPDARSGPPCWVCGSARVRPWRKGTLAGGLEPDDLRITDPRYGLTHPLVRCEECGFRFADTPDLDRLLSLYEQLSDPDYEASQPGRRLQMRRLVAHARQLRPEARSALDVGAASGLLVAEARAAGLDAVGVEPSQSLAERARSQGLDVRLGVLPHPELDGRRFDLVFLVDVLEHVPDPVGLLRRCREHLAEDGLLVVETPDLSSLAARLLGSRCWHCKLAHVGYFDRRSLQVALARAGLRARCWQRPSWSLPFDYLAERLEAYLPIGALNRLARRTPGLRWLYRRTVHLSLRDSFVVYAEPL